ncbi:phage major tail protein, phi13 family [Enterococcus faecalis 06-MB-DW-09]|uniref:major tail protein n=1 Tax=Enterococcus entomosocium TaxID=3034352 RepID=UPI000353FFD4|nr:phage major tail protein, phi13 family [Enterococcus faecalis 06-MB-DW-09]
MAETTNTVKIGLDNWEVAKLDESDRVTGQPMRIPGLTSAQLALTFNTGTFQADDALWAILDGGISGLALTIGNADIKSEHKAVLHGIELEDGMEVYTADMNIPYTAHIFRSRLNTGQFVWFGLVKGKFMPGGVDLNTRAETPTGQPDSVVGNFEPRNDGITHIIARADSPDFDLAKFRQKVFRGITIPEA